jgi:NADPH:quinone reductase-like Zn-dependent oxidoreductase
LNEKFDVVFDTVGKSNILKTIKIIKEKGLYIHAVTTPATSIKIRLCLLTSNKKLIGGTFKSTNEQINFIKKLALEGRIKPYIDRNFKFEDIVDAHKYVDKGHKKGNVTITIKQNE